MEAVGQIGALVQQGAHVQEVDPPPRLLQGLDQRFHKGVELGQDLLVPGRVIGPFQQRGDDNLGIGATGGDQVDDLPQMFDPVVEIIRARIVRPDVDQDHIRRGNRGEPKRKVLENTVLPDDRPAAVALVIGIRQVIGGIGGLGPDIIDMEPGLGQFPVERQPIPAGNRRAMRD